MFDHVTIRASDLQASERFYRPLLEVVGIEPTHSDPEFVEWDDFGVKVDDTGRPPTRHLHIAFAVPSPEHVDRWWQAGIEAGYEDAGPPGPRPQYMEDYYGGFLRDPDGNSVEAVHHGDIRRGGHIDHLWIGVPELGAAAEFYRRLSRYLGLREGTVAADRVQFRGAWATFSLVADGRPPTEGLHIAFPAPDRQTVDDFHAAAAAHGYQSDGGPGPRPQYSPGYYGAFVIDPAGTSAESVFHDRRGS